MLVRKLGRLGRPLLGFQWRRHQRDVIGPGQIRHQEREDAGGLLDGSANGRAVLLERLDFLLDRVLVDPPVQDLVVAVAELDPEAALPLEPLQRVARGDGHLEFLLVDDRDVPALVPDEEPDGS